MRIADQLKRCKACTTTTTRVVSSWLGSATSPRRTPMESPMPTARGVQRTRRRMVANGKDVSPTPNSVVLADVRGEPRGNHVRCRFEFLLVLATRKTVERCPADGGERLLPSPTNKGTSGRNSSPRSSAPCRSAGIYARASWRSRQEALYAFGERFQSNVATIPSDLFVRLLRWVPLVEDFLETTAVENLESGAFCSEANCLGARRQSRCGLGLE